MRASRIVLMQPTLDLFSEHWMYEFGRINLRYEFGVENFKFISQTNTIRKADGLIGSDACGAHWAEYCEQLYIFYSQRGQFSLDDSHIAAADPPINETAHNFAKLSEALKEL